MRWRSARGGCSPRAGRSATACSGRLKYELRLTWLGGTRILDRLERADFDAFAHRPTLTARDIAPLVWRTASWIRRPAPERVTVARDTNFYYSFLVLPAEKRRAIIAVWDFCRAVDDAVDEAPAGAGSRRCGGA